MSGSLSVERTLHRRMVRTLTRRHLLAARWPHLLLVVSVVLAGLAITGERVVGLVAGGVVLLALVAWRRHAAAASLRHGLGVGQSVSAGYTPDGELVVADAVGRVWLPAGSAHRVVRAGPLAAVVGRDLVLAVPVDLLDDDDVAFLEGSGEAGPATEPARRPPRQRLVVDAAVQADLVAAWTRSALTRSEVLLWALVGLAFVSVAVSALVTGDGTVAVFFLVVALVVAAGGALPHLRRGRRLVAERHPLDSTLRAGVDGAGVTIAGVHSTVLTPWTAYRRHAIDDRVVRLWRNDRALPVQLLPVRLLPPAARREIAERVPTS